MGKDFWRRFRKNRLALAGSVLVLFLFFVSLLAPWLAPYDPNAIDLKNILAPPSASTGSVRISWAGMCAAG
jgi:peptide/nickel transport system permease protein